MVDLKDEVWLLRHGATEWSEAGRYCGHADPPLSVLGRLQVRSRRAEVARISVHNVWSSDLQRCVETARIVNGATMLDRRLREFDFGDLDGMRFDELDEATQRGIVAFDGFSAPGGETASEFATRIEGFFDELPAGPHLIITHGGVIRFLLRQAGHDFQVHPGALVQLSAWSSEGWAVGMSNRERARR